MSASDLEIATERLHLRPLRPSDEALYCRLYTDPLLMRHIGPPLSDEAARRAFLIVCQATVASATRMWVIDRQATPVGIAACVRNLDIADEAELGLMLVADAQGIGLAAEALAALTGWVFDAFAFRRVWTRHAPGNLASVQLMRRLRFSPVATTADQVEWQMLSSQWAELSRVGCEHARSSPAGMAC